MKSIEVAVRFNFEVSNKVADMVQKNPEAVYLDLQNVHLFKTVTNDTVPYHRFEYETMQADVVP